MQPRANGKYNIKYVPRYTLLLLRVYRISFIFRRFSKKMDNFTIFVFLSTMCSRETTKREGILGIKNMHMIIKTTKIKLY